ncbi:NACHT, LRR and PYD domains-containing protein 12-like [Megalops cyprinoides]|uniref:NACHT, LRR and PYD domains-containing protein 12-like n=1 Tax=Megalops cyprinoides TaxID=118141 RepID=UPI0018643C4C|nr:NACHT, LRR and PYD domains-containing protein 12-like [Megalops cyprinoides]
MCDETQISSVPEILINLIKGNLLPSALLWITSRPEAAHQIPPDFIHRVTEIHGFSESQKEEYFKKRFADDENQACEILSSLKSSRSLYSMCHVPVFCWITATVLEQMLREAGSREIPKSLTEMYTQFLLIQINPTTETHCDKRENKAKRQIKSNIKSILQLGKLAFQHLEMREVIIDKNGLRTCDTDISQDSVYSALCKDMLQGHSGIAQGKVYSFIHPSLQDFLAALYVIFSYSNDKRNLLDQTLMGKVSQLFKGVTLFDVHKSAVNRALKRKDKHLDLFLRFLLGISSYSNGTPLRGLLRFPELGSESIDDTVRYITRAIKKSLSPEGRAGLLQCLIEMKNCSLAGEAKGHQGARDQKGQELAPASMHLLGEFDLRRYIRSDEELLTFLGMVQCTRRALLHQCNLTEKCCKALAAAMSSELRELDLSDNDLEDTGVILLSTGLGDNCCELEILSLKRCKLTDKCCEALASALISNPSHLRELHLSGNDLLDSGVTLLSAGLGNPHCKLETLGSVLRGNPHCKLETLGADRVQTSGFLPLRRLSGCRVTEAGCASLASALRSNPSHLRELDLSYNHPGDSGVRALSAGVEDPSFKLERLIVDYAGECRVSSGLWKYACELTLDPNTAHRKLALSEGSRRVTLTKEQAHPDHPGRFEALTQVLCREGLSGSCCYWEVEWSGTKAVVGAAYNGIERKTGSEDARLGRNSKSWSVVWSPDKCFAWHKNKHTKINFLGSLFSRRMGVYLDWPAGTLSFFSVLSHGKTHLHTFRTTFTEPLYPGFRVYSGSVTLSPVP